MTYGIDQCRVCGIPIRKGKERAVRDAIRAQIKPIVPEAKWRKMGLLASPSRYQLSTNPADGCCQPCGEMMMNRRYRYRIRFVMMVGAVASLIGSVFWIAMYMRH
jgi:predicted nucleic acid-binding Zn ribbon protein